MSWFTTEYLDPEALHNVWFELDQPMFVIFHKEESILCKDFEKIVLRAMDGLKKRPKFDFKFLLMKCEDPKILPKDYKVLRFPCVILYDGVEKDRINSMVSETEMTEWIENVT